MHATPSRRLHKTRRSAGRARGRRLARPSRRQVQVRRRRATAILLGLLALVGVLVFSGIFDRAIREVTLPLRHDDIIRQQAADKEVDAALIAAVIYAESRFRDQTSHADARGLMQITPQTAEDIERWSGGETFQLEDLSDPQINISYGTFYLRELLDLYEGNEVAALAAYNAGPGNANSWGGSELSIEEIPTAETRGYIEQVLDKRGDYRNSYAKELGY